MSDQENPLNQFSPQVREDVEGLIHLGELSTDVTFCGHTWGLRTLRLGEEIAAGVVAKPYRDTLKEAHAFIGAQVGLALTHVDGETNFCPPAGPDEVAYARARYNYVTKNWFWPTVNYLNTEYAKLLDRQVAAVQALQDLSERSQPMFSPLLDSWTAVGISADEIPEDLRDSAS